MGHQAVLAAFLLIINSLNVLSHISDPACLTPYRLNGFCVPIERCRNIYDIINDPTNTPSRGIQNYIKKAACTLPGVARSVCCKSEQITPQVTITTTTPTPTTTTISIGRDPAPDVKLNWRLLPTDDCGFITKPRIAYGNKTFPFEYPWMVLLIYQSIRKNQLTERCGGSLINNRYVLTAAHCLKTASNLKLVKVRLGDHDLKTPVDCIFYHGGGKDCADAAFNIDIEKTIIHRKYNRPIMFRNDIGLIRMAKAVEHSASVMPICLPVDASVRKNVLSRYIVTGWGTTENQTISQVLLEASVKHVPIPECQHMMNHYFTVRLAEPWQMCAMGDNKASACRGDSGGPVGISVAVSGLPRFVQFGVVSAGADTCGKKSMPGIYTRVSAYMDWIVANMRP